jgi:hypothetical protein
MPPADASRSFPLPPSACRSTASWSTSTAPISGAPLRGAPAGTVEAIVVNAAGERIARIERSYVLTPDSYEISLAQHVQNLSAADIKVRWYQFGPVDLPNDTAGGTSKVQKARDMRRVRFGYLLKPAADPTRKAVFANYYLWPRTKALGKAARATGLYADVAPIWPNPNSDDAGLTLAWAAMTNRYFGVAAHPIVTSALPFPRRSPGSSASSASSSTPPPPPAPPASTRPSWA